MRHWILLVLFPAVVLGACGSEASSVPGAYAGSKPSDRVLQRLTAGPTFVLRPDRANITIDVRPPDTSAERSQQVQLPLRRGQAKVRALGQRRLTVEQLVFELEDAEIVAPLLPNGLRLTDIRVQSAGPSETTVEWMDAHEAYGEVKVDLWLDWAFAGSGDVTHPLARQQLRDVVVALDVHEASGGRLHVELVGDAPGVLWRWGGLGELSNLELEVAGEEAPGHGPSSNPPAVE